MSSSFDDPEKSFRRGYVHGAVVTLNAIAHHLPADEYIRLRKWVDVDLAKWRLAAKRKKSTRNRSADVNL